MLLYKTLFFFTVVVVVVAVSVAVVGVKRGGTIFRSNCSQISSRCLVV